MALPEKTLTAASNQASKAALASVAKMRELFRLEGFKAEPQYTIDAKGTIIFKLPDCGTVRDAEAELHYSPGNDLAQRLGAKLAQSRWGSCIQGEAGILKSDMLSVSIQKASRYNHGR
jgi:hypothetical protein